MDKKGFFITVEGIDGTGKSTQVEFLAKCVADKGDVVVTREPGGGEISEKIRDIILNPGYNIDIKTELLLFEAARAEHFSKIIKPALLEGKIVICERFTDSTIAYQGYARSMDLDIIEILNKFATEEIVPDLTLLFDIDPSHSYERIAKGEYKTFDRLEQEGRDFQAKVRVGYHELAKRYKERIKLIDITGLDVEQVHIKLKNVIEEVL